YGAEKFNVYVSTTNTQTTSFTKINTSTIVTPSVVAWNQHTFNLDAYSGQGVYIAIQCVSDDQFALLIDDFKVTTTGTLATSEVSKAS
ncbi:choice-of-anchor J domain-containing protein, partial [Bacillus sp. SIMBA_031]